MSRRRLLGLAGAATAGGMAAVVVSADPAAAAAMNVDAINTGIGQTELDSGVPSATFLVKNTLNHVAAIGVWGQATSPSSGLAQAGVLGESENGTGVQGSSANSYGLVASSTSGVPLRVIPSDTVGPPPGAHVLGDFYVDQNGVLFQCATTGVPARWSRVSPLQVLATPVRMYNSAVSGGPLGNGAERNVTVTNGGTIPDGVSAVLTNLACNNPSAGGFLAMFKQGTSWPGTSNLNFAAHQTTSNNATSAVSAANQVTVHCGGASTNFVVDVFGYYP